MKKILSYDEFYNNLKLRIAAIDPLLKAESEETGKKITIRFLDRGYHPDSGNTSDVEVVRVINALDYNITSDVLAADQMLIEIDDTQIRVDVKELYNQYKTYGMAAVAAVLLDALSYNDQQFTDSIKHLGDYNAVKDNLYVKPLHFASHKASLANAIYRNIGDFVLVLCLRVDVSETNCQWVTVPDENLMKWGMTTDQAIDRTLARQAQENPPRLYVGSEKVTSNPEHGKFLDVNIKFDPHKSESLTPVDPHNGAIAFFYPNVAARLAELIGRSYLVVFTSVNEVQVSGNLSYTIDDAVEGLTTVNKMRGGKYKLSDFVYRYNVEDGSLKPVGGTLDLHHIHLDL